MYYYRVQNYNILTLEKQIELIQQNIQNIMRLTKPNKIIQLEAINNCKRKIDLDFIKPYITYQDILEYLELKYLLLEK